MRLDDGCACTRQLASANGACAQGVTWELVAGTDVDALRNPTSGPIDGDNVWWRALTSGLTAAGVAYEPQIFPAATDSRFLRSAGVPCFGFSPMRRTPVLLHDHDERLAIPEFLRGIRVFEVLIEHLAAV